MEQDKLEGGHKVSDLLKVHIWNLKMKDGSTLKAATIEQPERKPSMCEGCPSPCCQGMFNPVLTREEFESRKFPMSLNQVPLHVKVQVPQVEKLIVLDAKMGCPYFDKEAKLCSLWRDKGIDAVPKACLAYDCREDERPEIRDFARLREKEWKGGQIVRNSRN